MRRSTLLSALVSILVLAAAAGAAQAQAVPGSMTFTARILDNGQPATGAHQFQFRLFDAPSGGTMVWQEMATISVDDGLVFHELGSFTPLDEGILDGAKLYLEVTVDGTAMNPRVVVVSVPYAVRATVAGDADQLGGLTASDFVTGVLAGNGLTGGGSTGDLTLAVNFSGSGAATSVSRSDHNHAGVYLPVGTTMSCGAGSFVNALSSTTGDVTCGTPAGGGGGDATPDTIADDGVISDAELSDTITVGTGGSVTWTALASYPAACAPGSAITALSDTITCTPFGGSAGDSTPDTIGDDGVISDSEAADALSINSGSLYAPDFASNVGVGTSVPSGAFQVSRTANFTESCAGGNIVTNASGIKFKDDPGGGCGDMAYVAYVDLDGAGAGEATRLEIGNQNDADDDAAFRTAAGRVHFGNTTTYLGDINVGAAGSRAGAVGFDPPTTTASSGVWLEGGDGEAGGFYADGDIAMVFSPGDPDLFRIYDEDGMALRAYFDGVGNLRVASGFTTGCVQDGDGTAIAGTCVSDRRLKTDIRPFAPMLDRVTRLQPVTYHWRSDEHPEMRLGTDETYGLIAQDVEAVFPEMVATSPEGWKQVDYSRLPVMLLQSVKELRAENQRLGAETAQLTAENAALAARLDRLEAKVLASAPARPAQRSTMAWAIGAVAAALLLLAFRRR
jgi:hypothetical protein